MATKNIKDFASKLVTTYCPVNPKYLNKSGMIKEVTRLLLLSDGVIIKNLARYKSFTDKDKMFEEFSGDIGDYVNDVSFEIIGLKIDAVDGTRGFDQRFNDMDLNIASDIEMFFMKKYDLNTCDVIVTIVEIVQK